MQPNSFIKQTKTRVAKVTDNQELEQRIQQCLAEIKDPETGRGLKKQVHGMRMEGTELKVEIGLTSFAWPLRDKFQTEIETKLKKACPALNSVTVEIVEHDRPPQPLGQVGLTAKAVIAVAAGKGGVGKSTVSTGLALTLKKMGCRVGLLDADVYGPSIPQLTGVRSGFRGQVPKVDGKVEAFDYNGIPLMSIGFMLPPGEGVVWRGPMLHSAVTSFVRDTNWGQLDYLIIDMPPGTGDVALSLSQLLPLTGAVIVCTPQEVALIDAIKAVNMFRKVKIPVLGLVENMSSFICPDNGKRYDIFGKGGAKEYAEQDGIDFLGEIPINIALRERGDQGQMDLNLDDPEVSPYLHEIASNLAQKLSRIAAETPASPQLPVLK
jgi:ATP-binding protein involved in chromosome partitioning